MSGMIPTSEGGGKRGRAEDIDWDLTKAEQEQVNKFKWSRVPTYEGDCGRKRVAISEGGNKPEPPEEEEIFYDCMSEEDKPDEEMKPVLKAASSTSEICQKILIEMRNKKRQEENVGKQENCKRGMPSE